MSFKNYNVFLFSFTYSSQSDKYFSCTQVKFICACVLFVYVFVRAYVRMCLRAPVYVFVCKCVCARACMRILVCLWACSITGVAVIN